eukprot:scaffold15451_cov118-Isochrysis_galbana.AAC.4
MQWPTALQDRACWVAYGYTAARNARRRCAPRLRHLCRHRYHDRLTIKPDSRLLLNQHRLPRPALIVRRQSAQPVDECPILVDGKVQTVDLHAERGAHGGGDNGGRQKQRARVRHRRRGG